MKIIFAGTPQFAAEALDAIRREHQVVSVLTQPDRPAGRGMKLTASPVKMLALQCGMPVLQPCTLKSGEIQAELANLHADAMVVAAYGLILPKPVLDIPAYGCLNIHASLLPRWRGAAPIQRALQAGDSETGITIMQMDEGLDTGDMLLRASCPITDEDNASTLHDRLASLGAQCILEALAKLPGAIKPVRQDNQLACYAAKLNKRESPIDWQLDAAAISRNIRAFNPFPLCSFDHQGSTIKVWRARVQAGTGVPGEVLQVDKSGVIVATGSGAIRLEVLQRPGGKAQPAAQFLQACPIGVGEQLAGA